MSTFQQQFFVFIFCPASIISTGTPRHLCLVSSLTATPFAYNSCYAHPVVYSTTVRRTISQAEIMVRYSYELACPPRFSISCCPRTVLLDTRICCKRHGTHGTLTHPTNEQELDEDKILMNKIWKNYPPGASPRCRLSRGWSYLERYRDNSSGIHT